VQYRRKKVHVRLSHLLSLDEFLCVLVIVSSTANNNDDCDGGWQSNFYLGDDEYCVVTEEESHAAARDICHDMNSELASITSDAECDYVADLMSVVCD